MFKEFVRKISIELKKDLPGFTAQQLMDPIRRVKFDEYLSEKEVPKKSAVLILFYPDPLQLSIKTVLILRPENEVGSHAGQVSFPGGGYDVSDKDLSETALREAEEEIGADRQYIAVAGALTPLYIPVSNYMVFPFVGIANIRPEFKIHPIEVESLLECDINEFLLEENKTKVLRHIKLAKKDIEVPCYRINKKIIWGATAMMISELEEMLRKL